MCGRDWHTACNVGAKRPTARRVPVASALVSALAVFVLAAAVSLIPADLTRDCEISWNEAHAATPVNNARGFIEAAAEQAGIAAGDLIATAIGVGSVSTGYALAGVGGVALGAGVNHNLQAMIEVADYPDYSTLTTAEQESWGTKENYDAAKFNALLATFGLADDLSDYYSSGGGTFEFRPESITVLQHLGQIGQTWINRLGVGYGEVVEIPQGNNLQNYIGEKFARVTYSGEGWPSAIRRDLMVSQATSAYMTFTGTASIKSNTWVTAPSVYMVPTIRSDGATYGMLLFSETPFKFSGQSNSTTTLRWPGGANSNASVRTYNGQTYYANYTGGGGSAGAYGLLDSNMAVNNLTGGTDNNPMITVAGIILFGETEKVPNYEQIPEYPQTEIPDDTEVYFPDGEGVDEDGDGTPESEGNQPVIRPDVPWPNYVTQPELPPQPEPRPENPFNPGDQSGGDEWKQETDKNVKGLGAINFERLFPFVLLYDLRLMWEKVSVSIDATTGEGIGTQAAVNYNIVALPLPGGTLELDLTDVHNLLLMTRPWVQILFVVLLLMATVEFWRGILTGD